MAEFTGERVIPGHVDPNLWNEHFARYAYAAQFAMGRRVVDLGCGMGYGTAELARHATFAVGVDLAPDAVSSARQEYAEAHFVVGSVEQVPLASARFDLVTAFEVIEHLENWQRLLSEARRLLVPGGLLLVSTPNKSYYAESRAEHGANPFHVHEFEYDEFAAALRDVFPHTAILFENHAEGIAIAGSSSRWIVNAPEADTNLAKRTHFYLGVASTSPLPDLASFIYLPTTANLLQEREHHIAKLAGEIRRKDAWTAAYTAERDKLLIEHQEMIDLYRRQQTEIEEQTRWTQQVNTDLAGAKDRIVQLQDEMAADQRAALATAQGYEAKITELQHESERASRWAIETEQRLTAELQAHQELLRAKCDELDAKCQELAKCVEYLHDAESQLEERTAWAMELQSEGQRLSGDVERTQALLNFARSSRWVQLGRRLGVGPAL